MLNPHDYYRAAKYLMSKYGADAGPRAAARAAQLATEGSAMVQEMWQLLAVTIREIEQQAG